MSVSEAERRLARARMLGERFVILSSGFAVAAEAEPAAGEPGPDEAEGTRAAASSEPETPEAAEAQASVEPADAAVPRIVGFDEDAWSTIRDRALGCVKCDLCESRTQVVWGSGTPRTGLMLVGEAPGYHEDQQGEAFVGRAGQLLTKILEAIGFGRDEVFITNVLKCRPPDNADPLPHQVEACEPYLKRQIELIDPAVIVTLGRHAARTLLGVDSSMGAMRGRVFRYEDVPLVATYHPAALLRNQKLKRPTWEDVQLARRIYDEEMERRGVVEDRPVAGR